MGKAGTRCGQQVWREADARTPAATTVVVVVGIGVTVIAAFVVALVGGFFTTLAPMVDPKTVNIHGVTQGTLNKTIGTMSSTIYWIALVAVIVALVAWVLARTQDRERAAFRTWAAVY